MQMNPQDPTFTDVLRSYRDALRKLWRGIARFRAARPLTKILIVIAILLAGLAATAAVALRNPARRAALAQRWAQGRPPAATSPQPAPALPVAFDPALARSIAAGVSNRIAYIDGYHATVPPSLLPLKDIGVAAFAFAEDFETSRRELFRSGVLIMSYDQKKPEPTEREYAIVRAYIAHGGRLMLLCPAWVWPLYEKKPLDRLPYNRIAREFNVVMRDRCADAPLKIVHRWFNVPGAEKAFQGVFSDIAYRDAYPVLAGNNGTAAAVAAEKGSSRLFLWAQNSLLSSKVTDSPEGKALVKRAFDWLLDDTVKLAGGAIPPAAASPAAADPAPGPAVPAGLLVDPAIARSIAEGIRNRVIYVDGYHAVSPPDLTVFAEAGGKPTVLGHQGFLYNRDQLFASGLLVMLYGMHQREPTAEEYAVLRQYIANGGRLLLACPAWVWEAYEHKPLASLPYDIIAREFGMVLDTSYAKPPLRAAHPAWKLDGLENELDGVFSSLGYDRQTATPILVSSDGKTTAAAATKGSARLVMWSQDNLLAAKTTANPKGRKLIAQMVNWLLEWEKNP
jgi:hypothetical protein